MASTECEPITGVWRLCPQRGSGAEPLVSESGGFVRRQSPLKLKPFCVVICLKWRKAAMFMSCFKVINDSDCQRVYICIMWQLSFNF